MHSVNIHVLQLAASRIAQCVENKDTTSREVVRMGETIWASYAGQLTASFVGIVGRKTRAFPQLLQARDFKASRVRVSLPRVWVNSARDIECMYSPEEEPEPGGNREPSVRWNLYGGFVGRSQQFEVPSASGAGHNDTIYRNPLDIAQIWDKRNLTYHELQDQEEKERLGLLYDIVHDIYLQFGCEWSNRVSTPVLNYPGATLAVKA